MTSTKGKKVMQALDFDGEDINEGDIVIIPHSNGAGKLVKGKVLSVSAQTVLIDCII